MVSLQRRPYPAWEGGVVPVYFTGYCCQLGFRTAVCKMTQPPLNIGSPRLTDLPGEKHPFVCQSCGGSCVPGFGNGLMRHSLDRWQECDHKDQKEAKVIVLCEECSARLVKSHVRLYHKLFANTPLAGCMGLCVDCRFRSGVSCSNPKAKANGGPGVTLMIAQPQHALIDGPAYSGPITMYPEKAKECKDKEKV